MNNTLTSPITLTCTFVVLVLSFPIYLAYQSLAMSVFSNMAHRKEVVELMKKIGLDHIQLFRASESELQDMKQRASSIQPGFCEHDDMKSTWRVSRIPYFVEWIHGSQDGSQNYTPHFSSILKFDKNDTVRGISYETVTH